MQEQAKATDWLLLPFFWKSFSASLSWEEPRLGTSSLAICRAMVAALVLHASPYEFTCTKAFNSHTTWKAEEADLSPNSSKNKLWTSIKSKISSALEKAGRPCLLPGKAARGGLHSGSQIQGRKSTQKKMIMGVLKTCPFLPSLGQYLQRGLMNKQTFFSG